MKYAYIIIICLYSGLALGQQQYSKNLDFAPGNFDRLSNILPIEDNFIVMAQGIGYLESTQDGLIARIDSKGNVIWKHRIYSDYGHACIAHSGSLLLDKNRLFGCYSYVDFSGAHENQKLLVFKIDINGNDYSDTIIDLNTTYAVLSDVLKIGNYYWLSILSEDYEHTYLKLNTNLSIDYYFINKSPNQLTGAAEDMIVTRDSNIIHSYSYHGQNDTWLKIKEYDLDLNIIREFDGLETNEFLSDIATIPTEDNGFMVAWNKDLSHTLYDTFPYPTAIYKLDSTFDVEWEYVFVHRGAKQFVNFKYIGEGKYLGCGGSDFLEVTNYDPCPVGTYNAWAFLIDEDGNLEWEKQIYDTRYTFYGGFFDCIKTDFGYAFVGDLDTVKETPSPYLNDPDGWYFTLDEKGCWNGNCNEFIFIESDTSSFTYVSTYDLVQDKTVSAYPNPTNGIVTIEHKTGGEQKLMIHNLSGAKILEQELYAKKSIINLSDLPNGIYILNVIDNKGVITDRQKIIVQH